MTMNSFSEGKQFSGLGLGVVIVSLWAVYSRIKKIQKQDDALRKFIAMPGAAPPRLERVVVAGE
jgi:hypothetical protein